MPGIRLERIIDAPLEKVWEAVDFKKSTGPYPMKVRLNGDPGNNGVGFTRAVTSRNGTSIERLLSVEPMKNYTYTLTEGAPVKKDYLGKVELTQKSNGTQITWTVTFTPKTPGTGWLVALVIKRMLNNIIDAAETGCRDLRSEG